MGGEGGVWAPKEEEEMVYNTRTRVWKELEVEGLVKKRVKETETTKVTQDQLAIRLGRP